jgi:hypothetical protein
MAELWLSHLPFSSVKGPFSTRVPDFLRKNVRIFTFYFHARMSEPRSVFPVRNGVYR